MWSKTELATTLRKKMEEKNLDRNALCKLLGVSEVMADKILCGDVVPSRHLEKQLVEKLGIPKKRVESIAARRERQNRIALEKMAKEKRVA